MDDAVESFIAFTGATPEVARRYLAFADNNPEQAVQLFFDSPDLATTAIETPAAPPIPSATRPPPTSTTAGRQDAEGIVHIDSDDDDGMEVDRDDEDDDDLAKVAALSRQADMEDDEAMARRMQEELYSSGGGANDFDEEGVRAPIARRTETLVGGPDDGAWSERDYMQAAVAQQMRNRTQGGMSSKS